MIEIGLTENILTIPDNFFRTDINERDDENH